MAGVPAAPLALKLMGHSAGTAAGGAGSAGWMLHELENTPGLLPGEVAYMKLKMGINPFLPVVKKPGLNNAYYSKGPPEHIAYDPRFGKPGILAHEVGHKMIADGRAGVLMKFLQDNLYGPSRAYSPLVSVPATMYAVRRFGRMGNPWSGAALGAGTSGVLGLGHILPEWKASNLAKKHYLEDRFGESRNNRLLNAALSTYLTSQMAGPALMGAITAMERSDRLSSIFRVPKDDAIVAPGLLKRLSKLFSRFK